MESLPIKRGDILKTTKFNEPVRVVNDPQLWDGFLMVDLLGLRTNTYRGGVIFTPADLEHLAIEPSVPSYQGAPKLFKLGLHSFISRVRLTAFLVHIPQRKPPEDKDEKNYSKHGTRKKDILEISFFSKILHICRILEKSKV